MKPEVEFDPTSGFALPTPPANRLAGPIIESRCTDRVAYRAHLQDVACRVQKSVQPRPAQALARGPQPIAPVKPEDCHCDFGYGAVMGTKEEVWFNVHYSENTLGPDTTAYLWVPSDLAPFVPTAAPEIRPPGEFLRIETVDGTEDHLGIERYREAEGLEEDAADESGFHWLEKQP